MFEIIKMYLSRYKIHIRYIRDDLMWSENNYLNDNITLNDFVTVLEDYIRINSAPLINQRKLFHKYIVDFCRRNNVDKYKMQNQIRNMKSPNFSQFDGNWYFSEIKK